MDPDLIRLILIVLGVLLVIGIYVWDRLKHAQRLPGNANRARSAAFVETGPVDATPPVSEAPELGELPESPPDPVILDERETPATAPSSGKSDQLDPDPADLGEWSAAPSDDADPQVNMDLHFDAHGDNDYMSTDPALLDEVDRLIVAMHLISADRPIKGPAIAKACGALNLVFGDMDIYHYHDGATGQVLFSMASMVEPGSFPAADQEEFATPGLTLFTQLPGARDGIEIYDRMLATAEKLASLLQVELCDERRNKLTRQMQEHTRESIVEHRRRLQLARSRH